MARPKTALNVLCSVPCSTSVFRRVLGAVLGSIPTGIDIYCVLYVQPSERDHQYHNTIEKNFNEHPPLERYLAYGAKAGRRALSRDAPLRQGDRHRDCRHPLRATHGSVRPTANHDPMYQPPLPWRRRRQLAATPAQTRRRTGGHPPRAQARRPPPLPGRRSVFCVLQRAPAVVEHRASSPIVVERVSSKIRTYRANSSNIGLPPDRRF